MESFTLEASATPPSHQQGLERYRTPEVPGITWPRVAPVMSPAPPRPLC